MREAIEAANANAGADEIVFADRASGTITLSSQLPTVTDPARLTIDGGGDVSVSGNNTVGIFEVFGKLALRNLTIADGAGFAHYLGNTSGGAIWVGSSGTLEVTNSTFSGNRTTTHNPDLWQVGSFGGAIALSNVHLVQVTNSTFSNNQSDGTSAIYSSSYKGTLEVANSAFYNNEGAEAIGSYWSTGGIPVTNSTISNNSGVGIYLESLGGVDSGPNTVTNSTISGNGQGGIRHDSYGPDNVIAPLTLSNTVLANNDTSCLGGWYSEGMIVDGGYNIEDGNTCGFRDATGSISDTDPLLDPVGLQDNGGPTKTIALLPDSPAVDLVASDACPPPQTDQRGVERPQGAACDSGAYELEQEPPQPQTKADCKKGGYKEFGFKNEGRCIAFVNRAARAQ